jgi:hypothetical protein
VIQVINSNTLEKNLLQQLWSCRGLVPVSFEQCLL